jgi:SAM-dependent methyltransferase
MSAFRWNDRFAEADFAYGREPNDFLRESAGAIPPGPVLCLAEGQGRNAVYLAGLGHDVEAVDLSEVGLARARELAAERGVAIRTTVADLMDFDMGRGVWSGIVSIFCHLPEPVRQAVHGRIAAALAPGGVLILEAYTPRQIALGTGGPRELELLCHLDALQRHLPGLVWETAREVDREIHEGRYHNGRSAVAQLLGRTGSARASGGE